MFKTKLIKMISNVFEENVEPATNYEKAATAVVNESVPTNEAPEEKEESFIEL